MPSLFSRVDLIQGAVTVAIDIDEAAGSYAMQFERARPACALLRGRPLLVRNARRVGGWVGWGGVRLFVFVCVRGGAYGQRPARNYRCP